MSANAEIKLIPIKQIKEPELQMRAPIVSRSLQSLKESIEEHGLLNPITVSHSGGVFEIIAGHRRYLACVMCGMKHIEAKVVDVSQEKELAIRFDENAERQEISIVEEAEYISSLMERYKMSQADVAKLLKKAPSYVSERVALSSYHPALIEALKTTAISFSVAREFNRINDEDAMLQHLRYAVSNGCTPATARMWRKQIEATKEYHDSIGESSEVSSEPDALPYYEPERICPVCRATVQQRSMQMIALCPECYRAATSPE